jgi:hypothetical protein
MQGASWINLLRRIPANLHDGMALTLSTGAEVVVQRLVKLDPEVAILRGRLAGTQDTGRLVVLPYSHLVAVNIARPLTDGDVDTIFGRNGQAFAGEMALAVPGDSSPGDGAPDVDSSANGEPDAAGPKPAMPSKNQLLAKLRARLSDGNRPGLA